MVRAVVRRRHGTAETIIPFDSPLITSIDDGEYCFDVTWGFDSNHPTLYACSGITVTCMIFVPQCEARTFI